MAGRVRELSSGGCFFEGPRWRDGRWWVSDFYRHTVSTVHPDGDGETVLEVPGQPSGLGWMPDGSLLVVSMLDHRLLRRWPDGQVTEHADLAPVATGPCNDMVVDDQGRAWVGNFGFDLMAGAEPRPAQLARVDPDGRVAPVAEDLYFPNGAVVTADGTTLIVAETFASRLTAFTIHPDGTLGERREWAQLGDGDPTTGPRSTLRRRLTAAPDGCCLDEEGCLWVADAVGGCCLRLAPGGTIRDRVAAPEGLGVFACMLGGADGRTLLLCCAPDSAAHRRSAAREATLATCRVDAAGAGWP